MKVLSGLLWIYFWVCALYGAWYVPSAVHALNHGQSSNFVWRWWMLGWARKALRDWPLGLKGWFHLVGPLYWRTEPWDSEPRK